MGLEVLRDAREFDLAAACREEAFPKCEDTPCGGGQEDVLRGEERARGRVEG